MIRAIGAVLVALGGLTLAAYGLVWLVLTGRGEMDWDVPYLPVGEPLPAKLPCRICRGNGFVTLTVYEDRGPGMSSGGSMSRRCPNGCSAPYLINSADRVAARRNHR